MNVKKESLALVGILFLVFGIEMIIIQRVVLNRTVSQLVIERFYPDKQKNIFMVKDDNGLVQVRPITVEVPDSFGHCVATSGLVLLLCCFIQIKSD